MKKNKIFRDKKTRFFHNKAEIFQLLIKVVILFKGKSVLKVVAQKILLDHLLIYECKVRIKNTCVVTGRSRAVYKNFRISRIQLRLLGSNGLFFGLKKHSW
jgi:ribosomal protein S14